MSRALVLFALCVGLALTPNAAFAQMSSGFTHCAPPTRPACIAAAVRADAVCDNDVKYFVTATFEYRECLARETERAVRDANDVIRLWRCRADRKKCER